MKKQMLTASLCLLSLTSLAAMSKIEVNLEDVSNMQEFHQRVAQTLDFPAYYGHNLDALWDILSERNLSEELLCFTSAQDFLLNARPEEVKALIDLLQDLTKESPGFRYTIKP